VIELVTPLAKEQIENLHVGDRVELSGYVYTARDAAHLRFCHAIERGEDLPIDVKNQVIYYAGPTPARPGRVIGSLGPTTSSRMDFCTPQLIERGLKGMIGKGERSELVREAIEKFKAIYLVAIGGAGALLSRYVEDASIVAYEDLDPEAIYRLRIARMPLIVAIDCYGRDIFQEEVPKWRRRV
jgi:fumarate hydratase subunit beta